jgi:hypothetical protein
VATITTDTFLDGGTARTAGEAWTCNGGRLTIRTDSRWHANAPASMTGTLGSLTISATLGGGYTIDGRNVRWLPYDGGTGNVPAIGTTVTGGTSGASGYLLGVWASLTSAPTAVGAAMPATGFIKLREATAAFVDNDALSGIGATANGADVVGWIEVVHDQAAAITVPRLGDFTVRGDWFELGTTSGSANQLMQVPTNGSSTTYVPGVWVETAVASGVYEFWPAIYAALMVTANLGTDARSKFVCMETDGRVRFGHNGTGAVGMVPASGLRVRVPNVFARQCTTAARATNAIPSGTLATRPDFATTGAGYIDIENCLIDWYLSFAQPYYVKLNNVATFDQINISECATALDIFNGGNGCSQSQDSRTVQLTSNFAGGRIEKWKSPRSSVGTTDHAFEVLYCIGQTFTECESGIVTFARSSGYPFSISTCRDLTLDRCRSINGPLALATCSDCDVLDHDHVDRYVGATNTTSGVYAVQLSASCNNILVDGLTLGMGGAVANCHPYAGLFSVALSKNCRFRNVGSRASFLNGGSASNPAYVFVSGGNNVGLKFQRIYLTPTRTGAISTLNSDKGNLYEHVYGDSNDAMSVADLNSTVRGCGGTLATTGQTSVYGTHFIDAFIGDVTCLLHLMMNEPTTETAPFVTVVSGTPKFTSAGGLVCAAVGDEIIFEMPYFLKGATGFPIAGMSVTGTNVTYSSGATYGNHNLYYQIDTGSGWNGSWKNLNQPELSLESISPSVGFKLKIRVVCSAASATNQITAIRVVTNSLYAAQTDNLYPLDTITLTLTGLKNPTEVRVFNAGTTTEIAGQESITSGTFSASIDAGAYPSVDISILALGYQNTRLLAVDLSGGDLSIPVQQQLDRQYANP